MFVDRDDRASGVLRGGGKGENTDQVSALKDGSEKEEGRRAPPPFDQKEEEDV